MEKTYKKLSENELEVTKEIPQPEVVKTVYERDFIEKQIEQITKQRDEYVAQRNVELAECESILAEMDKLGVTAKPVESTLIEPIGEVIP